MSGGLAAANSLISLYVFFLNRCGTTWTFSCCPGSIHWLCRCLAPLCYPTIRPYIPQDCLLRLEPPPDRHVADSGSVPSSSPTRKRTILSVARLVDGQECPSYSIRFSLVLLSFSPAAQRAVKVIRGANQRQVRKRLREVAQNLTAVAGLLSVQAEVVGVTEHLLEEQPRFL